MNLVVFELLMLALSQFDNSTYYVKLNRNAKKCLLFILISILRGKERKMTWHLF